MSNLETWSKIQINSLDVCQKRKQEYIEVLEAFSNQGHSGFSASYVLSYINKAVEKGYDVVEASLKNMLDKSKQGDEAFMQNAITDNIMEILNLFKKYDFGKEEAHNIARLMNWKPITPLTGQDEEWGEVASYNKDNNTQQNKVCSAVFRQNFDNSTAHMIEGRVFSENGGHTWFSRGGRNRELGSSIPVTFPFTVPDKPEYIYLDGEDGEVITDKARIKELYDDWGTVEEVLD